MLYLGTPDGLTPSSTYLGGTAMQALLEQISESRQ